MGVRHRRLVSWGSAAWLAGLCLALAGCGANGPAVKHRSGVIAMGPHITETVFALGQGENVVAVGSFDDYPPEVQSLPKAGGYIDPDLEKITALAPAKLIIAGKNRKLTEYSLVNGVPVVSVDMDSMDSIYAGITEIGKTLDCEKAARELCAKIGADLQRVRDAVKGKPRPKVLIITGRSAHDLNSLNTVGGDRFISEMVDIAGGDNIFADSKQTYFDASKETVVMKAPEAILEFHCGEGLTESQRDAYIQDWRGLDTLPAVKSSRVYLILESHGMRPGPRIGEIAAKIARLLHPGAELPS
jgi:iron complex transport system substrate-binding protein